MRSQCSAFYLIRFCDFGGINRKNVDFSTILFDWYLIRIWLTCDQQDFNRNIKRAIAAHYKHSNRTLFIVNYRQSCDAAVQRNYLT